MTVAFPPSVRVAGVCMIGLALASCASGNDFPSLARRPAERISGTAAPAVPPASASTAPSGDTATQLAKLQETARTAHNQFATRRAAAEQAAAAAGPLGSESWAAASVALAGLEEAHEQQTTVLTSLDQLQVDRQVAEAGAEGADVAAIVAAHDAVAAAAEADAAVVARLRQRLGK